MTGFTQIPKPILKFIHYPPQIVYALGFGPLIGKYVLLLTTIGRKSGKNRVTPLQYEEIDGRIFLGAAFGTQSDWIKNIMMNPEVRVRKQSRQFSAIGKIIFDQKQIVDFLQIRLQRHPKMMGKILRSEGISTPPSEHDLVKYSNNLVLVELIPH